MSSKLGWVLGHHAVQAVLSLNPERALSLHVVVNHRNASQTSIIDQAQKIGLSVQSIDKQGLTKACGSEQHQGIGLQAKPKEDGNEQQLKILLDQLLQDSSKSLLLLILDQVQDPHNFGACLRTADAAGVDAVIVAKDNASPMTSVVQKVASGAAESMPIYRVANLVRTMQALKQQGVWVIGTSDKASDSLYHSDLSAPLAVVMGAEGKGLRSLTEKTCDSLVRLPMAGSVVSSLNVSVATGVCLYEVVRQRSVVSNFKK